MRCQSCDVIDKQNDGSPKFRGSMLMLQKVGKVERKLGVVLSIYSTSFDLHAVVSQDRNIIVKDCGYIRLRNCTVSTDMDSQMLEIVEKNCDGIPLRFRVLNKQHLHDVANLLHLNSDHDEIFSDTHLPTVSSGTNSGTPAGHVTGSGGLGMRKLLRSTSPVSSGSPRVSPNAKRKLSMPVLAEAGDVTLHLGDTLHAAHGPTGTGEMRQSLIVTWRPPDSDPHDGQAHYNDALKSDDGIPIAGRR